LLGVIEAVNNASGSLVLSNLSSSNRELFELLGLMSHVEMEDTEQAALERLRGEPNQAAM
jgi:anti-anti-sigma regulatory factor